MQRRVLVLLVRWAGLEELQDVGEPCDPLRKGHQLPGRCLGGRGGGEDRKIITIRHIYISTYLSIINTDINVYHAYLENELQEHTGAETGV